MSSGPAAYSTFCEPSKIFEAQRAFKCIVSSHNCRIEEARVRSVASRASDCSGVALSHATACRIWSEASRAFVCSWVALSRSAACHIQSEASRASVCTGVAISRAVTCRIRSEAS